MAHCFTSAQIFAYTSEKDALNVLLSFFNDTDFDKVSLLRDIEKKEADYGIAEIGEVRLHTICSSAVHDIFVSCAIFEKDNIKRVELFAAWDKIREHTLDRFSRLVDILQKSSIRGTENTVFAIRSLFSEN